MMTQTGTLTYGVEHEGVVHTEFELRLPTIGDNIAALELVGAASNMKVNAAMLAASLLRIGTIPKETLTYEFLCENVVDDDFDTLVDAQVVLKKKRMASLTPSPTTGSSSSSLDDTASPSPVSPS